MGNAESGCAGASGDEEDVEAESPGFAEGSPASGATRVGAWTARGSGSGKSGRPTTNNPPSPNGPPTPGVLLEQVKLREAAARISDSGLAIPESVLAGNEIALMRWLEDRLSRGEESVNVEQFCEMLEIRNAPRDECEEVMYLRYTRHSPTLRQADRIDSTHVDNTTHYLDEFALFYPTSDLCNGDY